MEPFQKPKCLALILCEQVIEDKQTNNKSLIGIFSRITGTQIPFAYPRFFIFASLMGGRGTVPLDITITSLQSEETVLKMTGKATFKDPLAVTDLVLQCRNVPIKEAGFFAINVSCEGEFLSERRFEVQIQNQKNL